MHASRLPVRLLAVATVLAVAAALAWGFVPRPVAVEVRAVTRGRIAVVVSDDGVTRIRERHVVRAPLTGQMSRVTVRPGARVTAGGTVITAITPPDPSLLDPRAEAEARARVETAQALLDLAGSARARAEVQVEYTAADLDRARELFPQKVVTHEQLDMAERAWKTAVDEATEADEEIHVARHLVKLAEAALVRSRPGGMADDRGDRRLLVTAPIDGTVLRVKRTDAGPVEAGAELVEVGDLDQLEAVIDVVSEDAARVAVGAPCAITAAETLGPLPGRVRVVEPRGFTRVSPLGVEEQRVNVIVDIEIAPGASPTLGDDYHVDAVFTVDEASDVVLVPLAALFHDGDVEAVFVVSGGRARLTPVTIGRRGDHDAEVRSGLVGGEGVVVYPADAIADGTRVVQRSPATR